MSKTSRSWYIPRGCNMSEYEAACLDALRKVGFCAGGQKCENKGENEVCPPCGAKVYEDGLRYPSRYSAEKAARSFLEEVRVLEEKYGVRHEDRRRWLVYNEMLGCGATDIDIDWKPHWELRTRADCEKAKNPLKNEGSSPCG